MSREEFRAIRRLSTTSVSLSKSKTGLDQSEAVKIVLGKNSKKLSEVQFVCVQGTFIKIFSPLDPKLWKNSPINFPRGGVRTTSISLFLPLKNGHPLAFSNRNNFHFLDSTAKLRLPA